MKKVYPFLCLFFTYQAVFAQNDYYFPGRKFNPSILSPDAFLGYSIGSHHTRYDQMVSYFEYLSRESDRVKFQTIGKTYEYRPQLMVVFSSPQNLTRLENIRTEHLRLTDPTVAAPDIRTMPVIMQLGHNVHGNEASGGESSLLTAYFLAACTDPDVIHTLNQSVIFIEPVINPDGRDRFVNWVNMHKGMPPVADPNDREHNEVWPSGRVNHYWFDLNRDWYLAVHRESKNRLNFYHQWYPNVVTDHHEMGTNSTHFFEPSKVSAENPLVPPYVYRTLNDTYARYFEQAMNQIGSLYYTKESFDNLYPGYGSSYPDIEGGIGFLFEQGSSRGHVQDSQNGPLTYAFAVRNQLVNALATIRASVDQRENLLKFQREFFETAISSAQKSSVKGYVVSTQNDQSRAQAFLQTLLYHKIQVYDLPEDLKIGEVTYQSGKAYYVPTAQPQYRMVQSVFEKPTTFADSLFYDASAWNLPLAYGLPFSEIKSASIRPGNALTTDALTIKPKTFAKSSYAYLLPLNDFNVYKALHQLTQNRMLVKAGQKPFSIQTDRGLQVFAAGTLLIPVQPQMISADSLHGLLSQIASYTGVHFYAVETGYSQTGVDLGSNTFETITLPRVVMPIGKGTSQYEAGEVWFMTDQYLGMPITKVDLSQWNSLNLNAYNVLVMVNGQYPSEGRFVEKIKNWVAAGGTLITFKSASHWAIKNNIISEKIRELTDSLPKTGRMNYENAEANEGSKYTGGAIFSADLDLTHPLGFGFSQRRISLYRNSNTLLEISENPYQTVVQYDKKPLLNGYVHPATLSKISSSAGLIASTHGAGKVILFADNPNFRGTWLSTSRLFFNSIFFSKLIQNTTIEGQEE